MRKKRVQKKHTVKANVQILDLTKAGSSIEFVIRADEKRIGRIVIGRGSLTWFGGRRKHSRRYTWSAFAEMMDKQAYS